MAANKDWKIVWITGASSGIGRELAFELARRGSIVAVSARSADTLAEMHALDGRIKSYPLDVSDAARTGQVFAQIERELGPVDLAILNAGVWQLMAVSDFSASQGLHSMTVNYFGVLNGLEHVMRSMVARGSGQIAVMSSVAGYRGLLKGAAYAPTKAALISLCEALYPHLRRRGVSLSVVNPGFVETPMTEANDLPKPFMISVEAAASKIISGLERGKYEIVFPWRMMLLMKTLRLLPNGIFFWIVSRAAERAGTADTGASGVS